MNKAQLYLIENGLADRELTDLKDHTKWVYVSDAMEQYAQSKILDSENTKDVSSAEIESSVYTDVGESHASEVQDTPVALVDGALEKITSEEKFCQCVHNHGVSGITGYCLSCNKPKSFDWQKLKSE